MYIIHINCKKRNILRRSTRGKGKSCPVAGRNKQSVRVRNTDRNIFLSESGSRSEVFVVLDGTGPCTSRRVPPVPDTLVRQVALTSNRPDSTGSGKDQWRSILRLPRRSGTRVALYVRGARLQDTGVRTFHKIPGFVSTLQTKRSLYKESPLPRVQSGRRDTVQVDTGTLRSLGVPLEWFVSTPLDPVCSCTRPKGGVGE